MAIALEPFQHRSFRLLFTGRLVSYLGNAIAPVALAFAVLDLTGSAGDLGLVLAARSVPLVVFILVGGVVADRLPRHVVMLTSNVVSGLSQGAVAALLLSGHATIGWLIVLEIVGGTSSAFLMPAAAAITPSTVPPGMLQQANALLRLGQNSVLIGGSALAGLLVATIGPGGGLVIDAVTFLLGALVLSRLDVPAVRAPGVTTSAVTELREGWTEFRSRTWVWVIVVQFAFVNAALAGAFGTLGPAISDGSIGRTGWGLVLATQTAGMVLGGLLGFRLRVPRQLLLGTALILLEVPVLLALGIQPLLGLLLPLALLAGIGIEIFGLSWDLSLQQHVPAETLSRVYSYDALGSFVFIPIGQVLAGPLASQFGTEQTVVGAGVVVLAATLAALAVPSVRLLRRTDLAPATPAAPAEPAAA